MDATKFRFISNDIKTFPSTGIGEVAETTSEWYYHMLNAVPPLKQFRKGFICGEPYTHLPQMDEEGNVTAGHPVHRVFYTHNDRYFTIAIPIYESGQDIDAIIDGIIELMHNQPSTL